jgi:hypothetical protein
MVNRALQHIATEECCAFKRIPQVRARSLNCNQPIVRTQNHDRSACYTRNQSTFTVEVFDGSDVGAYASHDVNDSGPTR